jgi:zinc/manganese transport system substrate-binding protein
MKMRTILDRRPATHSIALAALALAAATALAACGDDDDAGGGGATVVASTTQAADLARNVAGDRAAVVGILAPNSDPHDYEPRPSDVEALVDADLVVKSGGDLDLWLDELVESSGSEAPEVTLLDAVETIEGEHGHEDEEHAEEEATGEEDEHAEEEVDPHWWQDPTNAILAVEALRDQMTEVDPDGADEYERNASRYIGELERLDREIAACMDAVPAAERKLVTSHDALGYFADRYEVEIVGATIPALTTQAQPSAGATAELVDLIREEDVKAVFPEVGVSSELEQAVADETGAEIGGELYSDALGSEDTPGATYVGAMEANAATLAGGFSGGERTCE